MPHSYSGKQVTLDDIDVNVRALSMGKLQVNVLLVLEILQNSLKQSEPANLMQVFELLTQLPDDFMNERMGDIPQSREEWL